RRGWSFSVEGLPDYGSHSRLLLRQRPAREQSVARRCRGEPVRELGATVAEPAAARTVANRNKERHEREGSGRRTSVKSNALEPLSRAGRARTPLVSAARSVEPASSAGCSPVLGGGRVPARLARRTWLQGPLTVASRLCLSRFV